MTTGQGLLIRQDFIPITKVIIKVHNMRYYLLLSLPLLLCSMGCRQTDESSDSQPGPSNEISAAQISMIIEKAKGLPDQAQMAIAVIENGKPQFYGIKVENDSALIFDNHQLVFEIGSITKVFTSTLLAELVLEEKVALDDPINKFLDFTIKDEVQMSLKQLATHSSGLPRVPASLALPTVDMSNPYKEYDEATLKIYLTEKLEMTHVPGEVFEYSNLGGGLLGYVLEQVAGLSYEDLLQKYIFSKYQMRQSTTHREIIADQLVVGLNDEGEEVSQWDMAVLMGAGGIVSTVEDLAQFALAQFDDSNKALSLTREKFFAVSDQFSSGLGWSVIARDSGAIWNWHNGGTGGYSSSMIMNVEQQNAVIILSNISALGELSSQVTGLCPALMGSLEGE